MQSTGPQFRKYIQKNGVSRSLSRRSPLVIVSCSDLLRLRPAHVRTRKQQYQNYQAGGGVDVGVGVFFAPTAQARRLCTCADMRHQCICSVDDTAAVREAIAFPKSATLLCEPSPKRLLSSFPLPRPLAFISPSQQTGSRSSRSLPFTALRREV